MALTLAVGGIKEKPSAPTTRPPALKSARAATQSACSTSFELSAYAKLKVTPPPMTGRRPPDFSLLGALDKYLFKSRNKPNSRSRGVFHPSEMERCKRYLALDYLVCPMTSSALDARVHRIFENGEYVHMRIQRYLKELANSYGIRAFFKKEQSSSQTDLEIDGSNDGLWKLDEYLWIIEIKSINKAGFDKLRKPMAKHGRQLNIYMGALGIQSAIIIYECKDNQDWKEYRVDFDPALWQETVRVIEYVRGTVRDGGLPPKEESSECRGCRFFQNCIKNDWTDGEWLRASGRTTPCR